MKRQGLKDAQVEGKMSEKQNLYSHHGDHEKVIFRDRYDPPHDVFFRDNGPPKRKENRFRTHHVYGHENEKSDRLI